MMRWLMGIVVAMLVLQGALAQTQPTQQYNKIFLEPFYRASMSQNTNYTYNLTVSAPDGIESVRAAILTLDVWLTPTVTFTVWVNGQSCKNPAYVVSTTYATTGNGQAIFDCTNVIKTSGTYNVTVRPTQANTGASSMWLDLTYMNRPLGSAEVHGTEYVAGDPGTTFLLLKDSQGIPIANASCTVDIYYPNLENETHPIWIDDGVMLYLEEGLYYYDFTTPAQVGLYMVNAQCRYTVSDKYYYTLEKGYGPTRNVTLGTFTGDTFVLNDYQEWLYTQCDSTTAGTKACEASYSWILDNTTFTSLALLYLGESGTAPTMTYYWWNWSGNGSWVALPNTLTFKGTAATGVPSGVDEYMSNTVPVAAIRNTTKEVRIRTYATAGATFKIYSNWITLKASQETTAIQELKGSGEIHVSSQEDQGETSRYLRIDTCDGFADGRCGLFTNDEEFDLAEGEIEDWVNVTAYATLDEQTLRYYTPFSVDCTALYWIRQWNGTDWEDMEQGFNHPHTNDYGVYSQPAYENCEVTITRDVVSGETYQYWFKMDNYMKWEVDWSKAMSDAVNDTVARVCDPLRNYTVPVTENTTLPNDTLGRYCYEAKDDQYWINTYYNDSLSVDLAGEYASYVQEMRYYRPALDMRYQWLVTENDLYPDMKLVRNWTNQTVVLAQQINATTNQTQSLVQQIWSWVQSIFFWVQTDIDANASTAVVNLSGVNISVSVTTQTLSFVQGQYYQEQPSSVIVQLVKDGESVTNATCQLGLYYPNMTQQVTAGGMSFTGIDGMYNYTWTPQTYGSHVARANCSGGSLSGQVQASGSLGVSAPSTGVVMQVIA